MNVGRYLRGEDRHVGTARVTHRVACSYCNQPAKLVTGREVYPHRCDLAELRFWQCQPCDAYVGCHKTGAWIMVEDQKITSDGTLPLGQLANAELRALKSLAHRAFDALWAHGGVSRSAAYKWLARELDIAPESCHIGMMDEEGCRRVIDVCMGRHPRKVARALK